MTRTNALLVLVVAVVATAFAAGPAAASGGYESVNSITGTTQESGSYESVNSLTGNHRAQSHSLTASSQPSSVNAILAESPASSEPSSVNAVLAESPPAPADSPASGGNGYRTVTSVTGGSPSPTPLVEVRESSGFEWGDALIGAGVALALMLMGFGGARLIGGSRRRTAESSA